MISSRDASRTPRRRRLIFQSRDRLHRYHAFTLIACAILPRLVTSCRGVEASRSTQHVAKQPSVRVASTIHQGAPPVFRSTGQRQCLMRQCPVAPPGFCNGGGVRYGSIGGLVSTKSPSPGCIVCVSTWLFARRPCNVFVV